MKSLKDQRKHRTQMSAAEAERVERLIRRVSNWKFDGTHYSLRGSEKFVLNTEVWLALEKGSLIEVRRVKQKGYPVDVRATLRADVGRDSVIVCVSLSQRRVITVWRNALEDRHATLDLSKYTWRAGVQGLVGNVLARRKG